ncbi:glycoside hydrolase family 3 N-terminal domain-containing protein [Naasia lichenicola]|uniref:beta-glucosidase n=1 Tax=Naasia lichenicola TaxID=2565933 RepID=A0A4S4FQJ1_9MICO|nr:glycoside hydrolase family 3 N-terminal domain-containing protein [Naasia lichenicola]THG31656.1 glycosyl hydrolase [Naasia lichenicola]
MKDDRIRGILARMTWAEKLAQLQIVWIPDTVAQHDRVRRGIGAMFWPPSAEATNELQRIAVEETRLGIPLLIGLDVVHGQFTIFPTPLAQASSFDPAVAALDGRTSATEARSNGVNWTFSPMVDISVDPRWGRVVEGFGESPFLASAFAAAKVAAYQGSSLAATDSIAACLKHFIAYGAAEAGRDYNSTDVSNRRLRDVYLPPFAAGVRAGAASVMASFNSLNGVPMHANSWMLSEVLKDELGFAGVVVGDAEGASQLTVHGVAETEAEALALSITAGVDIVMGGPPMGDAVDDSSLHDPSALDVARVDDAVLRILAVKESLGLFDDPYVDASKAVSAPTEQSRADARASAERSVILLKNGGSADAGELLPLDPESTKRILLTGPYARSTDHLGAWVQRFGVGSRSLEETLRERFGQATWTVEDGAGFLASEPGQLSAAVDAARESDLVILAVGEPSHLSGEASSRSEISLPGEQDALIEAIVDTGVPVVVVLLAGRPLVVERWIDRVDSVLFAFHLGTEGPDALARVLAGDVSPAGRVPMTFPRSVGQIPIYSEHERTGRPASTSGSLSATKHDVGLEGPNNLDDSFTSKYLDLPLGPRFPFGHGLGYTTFDGPGLQATRTSISLAELAAGGSLELSAQTRNAGPRSADNVLMLFLSDPVASVAQPVRRLCGFARLHVSTGDTASITFRIGADEIGFWDDQRRRREPGLLRFTLTDGIDESDVSVHVTAS